MGRDLPVGQWTAQSPSLMWPVLSLCTIPRAISCLSPIEPRLLFSGSDDAQIHMYDSESNTLAGAMSGHASWVLSIHVAPDGAAIATASSDRTVRLWDLGMRAAIQTMSSHNDQVWVVSFRAPGGSSDMISHDAKF
ncbi:hypothetical protein SAY87_007037 [Trapa incisa]|uniref:Uncharacterized protein n=1 Tax=Trapa incisa TaxID=236973 RepID=A0AAN7K3F2_9MYRT|nr:hypothetical protein SAY87_007037 [Trapa incisa]